MDRFAGPLTNVARYAARQQVEEATDAARDLAELVLARYAWVSARRWLVATMTGLIAAMAALAGSALLFQQNQLLRDQSGLLAEQTERLNEQNILLSQEIALVEAERSTSIVPEILDIGSGLGQEVARLKKDGRESPVYFDHELSIELRARIAAATVAARPYRYLNNLQERQSDEELTIIALERRADLPPSVQKVIDDARDAEAAVNRDIPTGVLIDRPVSPERGQILNLLYNLQVLSTETLTSEGADFSFAELRMQSFGSMSLRGAQLRYSDFSRVQVLHVDFRAANLEQARFVRGVVANSNFGSFPGDQAVPPFTPDPLVDLRYTSMSGVNFTGTVLNDNNFGDAHALGANFDYALIANCDFTGADLAGATFRNAVIGPNVFAGANLLHADFDGALVFDESFIAAITKAAGENLFDGEIFELEPVSQEELDRHVQYVNSELTGDFDFATQQGYRVHRVGAFRSYPEIVAGSQTPPTSDTDDQ